jgi:CheY-like chemotaxis protein
MKGMEMPVVVVIDDDEQFLGLLRTMLQMAGYDVLEALDGRKGMRVIENTPVDLVITDVIMPDMEGLEVIMGLRRKFPHIKIIAVSGGARIAPDDYLNIAGVLGADRTFTKPFAREELLRAVRDLVG